MSSETKFSDFVSNAIGLSRKTGPWLAADPVTFFLLPEGAWEQVCRKFASGRDNPKGITVTLYTNTADGKAKLFKLLEMDFAIHSCSRLNQPTLLFCFRPSVAPPYPYPKLESVGLVYDPKNKVFLPPLTGTVSFGDPPNFLHNALKKRCLDPGVKIEYTDTVAHCWDAQNATYTNLDVYLLVKGSLANHPLGKTLEELRGELADIFGDDVYSAVLKTMPGALPKEVPLYPYELTKWGKFLQVS